MSLCVFASVGVAICLDNTRIICVLHVYQSIVKALHVAFIAAATEDSSTTNNGTTPNSYKEARASSEIAGWQQAMDTEMANLRKLGCLI